jgi:hypothetical protein
MTDRPMTHPDLLAELSLAHPDRYAAPACRCAVCVRRSARGEPALSGLSVHTEMHVTLEEMEDPRRAKEQVRAATERERAAQAAAAAKRAVAGTLRGYPKDFDILADAIAMYMVETFGEELAPLLARLDALEAAQRRLENFQYVGVWRADASYSIGNFATHDGGMWHCGADGTTSEPGTDASWQLVVKRGRDARARKGKP